MDKLFEIIMTLHPMLVMTVGALVTLFRMIMNGMLYKKFGLYNEQEYKDGLPFQYTKLSLTLFGGVLAILATVAVSPEQYAVTNALYAGFIVVFLQQDITQLVKLYVKLQKSDNGLSEKENLKGEDE